MAGAESYNALLSGAKYITPTNAAQDSTVNLSPTHLSDEVTTEELEFVKKTWQKFGDSLPKHKKKESVV